MQACERAPPRRAAGLLQAHGATAWWRGARLEVQAVVLVGRLGHADVVAGRGHGLAEGHDRVGDADLRAAHEVLLRSAPNPLDQGLAVMGGPAWPPHPEPLWVVRRRACGSGPCHHGCRPGHHTQNRCGWCADVHVDQGLAVMGAGLATTPRTVVGGVQTRMWAPRSRAGRRHASAAGPSSARKTFETEQVHMAPVVAGGPSYGQGLRRGAAAPSGRTAHSPLESGHEERTCRSLRQISRCSSPAPAMMCSPVSSIVH